MIYKQYYVRLEITLEFTTEPTAPLAVPDL